MKKILFSILIISLIGCESKTIEIEKKAGIILNGQNKGKKLVFGSDEDAQIALDMVQAYADRQNDKMNALSSDTVMIFPPQGGKEKSVAIPQSCDILFFVMRDMTKNSEFANWMRQAQKKQWEAIPEAERPTWEQFKRGLKKKKK